MKNANEIFQAILQWLGGWTLAIAVAAAIFLYSGHLIFDCNHSVCLTYIK